MNQARGRCALHLDGCGPSSFVPGICERSEDSKPDKIADESEADDGLDEQERGVDEESD